MTQGERDIYSVQGGDWGKSAYMLIYERKSKREIREVSTVGDNEVVNMVDYRTIKKSVPEWLEKKVKDDNISFVMDNQLYSNQFFSFIKLLLKEVANTHCMQSYKYPLAYKENFARMNKTAFQIGHKSIVDFLSHFGDNKVLTFITDYLSSILTYSESHISFPKP